MYLKKYKENKKATQNCRVFCGFVIMTSRLYTVKYKFNVCGFNVG